MAGIRQHVTLDVADAQQALATLRERAANLQPAMDAIGGHLVSATTRRFETESGPDGTKWTPSRRARKEGGQTLTDTARLRQSVTHNATADSVEVGTNLPYAAIHQFGGEIQRAARTQTIHRMYNARTDELGRRFVKRRVANFASDHAVGAHTVRMPARPFVGFTQADAAESVAILGDFLLSGEVGR